MPSIAGMSCDHSTLPDSGSTPASFWRVWTTSWSCRTGVGRSARRRRCRTSRRRRPTPATAPCRSACRACRTRAGLDVDVVAHDQGRADEAERGQGRLVLLDEIDPPPLLARLGIQADQHVPHPGHVQRLAVVGRGRANPVAVAFGHERDRHRAGPLGLPQFPARFAVQRPHDLRLPVLGLRHEDAIGRDDRPGVAGAQLDVPQALQVLLVQAGRPGRSADEPSRVGPRHCGQVAGESAAWPNWLMARASVRAKEAKRDGTEPTVLMVDAFSVGRWAAGVSPAEGVDQDRVTIEFRGGAGKLRGASDSPLGQWSELRAKKSAAKKCYSGVFPPAATCTIRLSLSL